MADIRATGGAVVVALGLGFLAGDMKDGVSYADEMAKWQSQATTVAVAEKDIPQKVIAKIASTGEVVDEKAAEEMPAKDVERDTVPGVLLPAFWKFTADQGAQPGDSVVVIVRNSTRDTTLAVIALSNSRGGVVVVKAQVGEQQEATRE